MATHSDHDLLKVIWNYLLKDDNLPSKADVIVVGGSGHDMGMAMRAAELYHQGFAPIIVTSGWAAHSHDGMETEAAQLAHVCIENGVPEQAVLQEPFATNTGDNIIKSQLLIHKKGIPLTSVILVHKPYMSRRFFATAVAQWPKPQPQLFVTHEQISFEDYCQREGSDEVIWKMLGDFKRMDEYVAKGFQSLQSIPIETQTAYDDLIARGYSTR